MNVRILPPGEKGRIETETPLRGPWASTFSQSELVVVEDAGAIVGTWGRYVVPHVEGFWVREDHRHRTAALRLVFEGMRELLAAHEDAHVVTLADTSDIAKLLTKAGARPLPGQLFLLPRDFGPWRKDGA